MTLIPLAHTHFKAPDKDALKNFINTYFSVEEKEKIITSPLTAGWSPAELIHLQLGKKHYVLRILSPEKRDSKECYMLKQASELGIGPHVHHIDIEKGTILMDYVNNAKTISLEEAHDPVVIKKMGETLAKAHLIPQFGDLTWRHFNKIETNFSHLKQRKMVDNSLTSYMGKVERLYKELLIQENPRVMIHGDLHVKNIFHTVDGDILLIDWEGACYDDPFFDLCYSAATFDYSDDQERAYLRAYLGRPPSPDEQIRYASCRTITLIGIYFELLDFAYLRSEGRPIEANDSIEPWGYYMKEFLKNSDLPSSSFIYNWAQSVLERL